MLKDRGHKGSWKGNVSGVSNARMKKKSYGNIHSINDRGIHEIYETLGGSGFGSNPNANNGDAGNGGGPAGGGGGSTPNSPWSSPLMGRKSIVTIAPQLDRNAAGKILQP